MTMNLSGCFSASEAFRSVVLNPFRYQYFRYVDCRMALSAWPSSKTSLIRSPSEILRNLSQGQCVSGGASW